MDENEILADQILDCGVSCPCASEKIPIDLQREKCCDHFSALIFELIFLILAGNKDMYKNLNGFEFGPHPTTDYVVSCH